MDTILDLIMTLLQPNANNTSLNLVASRRYASGNIGFGKILAFIAKIMRDKLCDL